MPVYIGNTQPTIFLGNINLSDNSIFVNTPPFAPLTIQYLLVAGGGGGGYQGGGGGAGGLLSGSYIFNDYNTLSVSIGNGGSGAISGSLSGSNGQTSSFYTASSLGGGGGASDFLSGSNGGSGGGAGFDIDDTYPASLNTNIGLGTAGQGNNGGNGRHATGATNGGCGGGGGASQVGGEAVTLRGGLGGDGSIWLDGIYYAGGGGGGAINQQVSSNPATGGLGGGGNGGKSNTYPTTGSANTGGGGGGGSSQGGREPGADGGSGICKIRYSGSTILLTGGTTEISGGYVYHTFTSSGNLSYPFPFVTTTTTTSTTSTTSTTTLAPSCTTYQVTNSSPSFGGQVSYIPCGKTGYRSQFVGVGETINLCVANDQIVNVSGYASSSLTDTNTPCTASLVDCISYTITNTAGVTRDYSGIDCSNCATSLYNINAGATVVRCFVSGTFATDYPANVTATAGATCNVSGSGCQIPL